ncbi:YoaK family protein [Pseudomonas sp. HR1]|uniref:YoaK family protein n=1 Tax=unclassified Pseudomonas TaxID=196821 RepID=UPI00226AF4BD|nr:MULTISPECIES: YoaK family protein [unclassified Pseudomonas]MDK4198806.1 YoaK family protein [Pseudomonas sp. HR1]
MHTSSPLPPAALPVAPRHGAVGLALVAGLSLLAGMTDAIGFLATGDFVSFMSGNTTRLAAEVAAGRWAAAGHLALAIGTFVLGNAGGVLLQRLTRQRACLLLGLLALLLALAASLPLGPLALLIGVFAMGMVNAVVEQVYGLPIGLTYVTGALSRFGRGLGHWLLGERRRGWRIQLVPWLGMLLGGVLGAALEAGLGLAAWYASAALAAILAVIFRLIPRAWQLGYLAS